MAIEIKSFPVSLVCEGTNGGIRLYIAGRFIPQVTLLIPDDACLGSHSSDVPTQFDAQCEWRATTFFRHAKNEYLARIGLSAEAEIAS